MVTLLVTWKHDARTPAMHNSLKFLDCKRAKPRPWVENSNWPQRFSLQTVLTGSFLHKDI